MAVEHVIVGVEVEPVFGDGTVVEALLVDGMPRLGSKQRDLIVGPAFVHERVDAVIRGTEGVIRKTIDPPHRQAAAAAGREVLPGE